MVGSGAGVGVGVGVGAGVGAGAGGLFVCGQPVITNTAAVSMNNTLINETFFLVIL